MRLAKLRTMLLDLEVDAILVSQPENRRYLSGFTGSAGLLLVSSDRVVLATDSRYYEQVEREAPSLELAKISAQVSDLLPDLLADVGVRRLGFESQHVTVDQLYEWSGATAGVEWVPLKQTVEKLRAVKEASELEAVRRSTALTDAAFGHLMQTIRPGMTEREAVWEIETYMRSHGASKVAFDLIVASGPNGALPHAHPSDRVIQAGDPIVVDIGCIVEGYCSDLTRTFCLSQASPKYLEVWEFVRRAQETAQAGIRAGTSGVQADALARDVIGAAGYGESFGHGLGHGVGLAVHEAPRASRLSEDSLAAGMILTVEPGIYLPGEFGVRLEDLVIIREKGTEVLTSAPKTPVLV